MAKDIWPTGRSLRPAESLGGIAALDVFHLRDQLVEEYREYVESFIRIKDERIRETVEGAIDGGLLWPAPLVQLNPTFEPAETVDELVADGTLHPECARIFRVGKGGAEPSASGAESGGGIATPNGGAGRLLRFHRHQVDAIRAARTGANYVLTTGTGSGKSLAYIVPIVDHVLRRGSGRGVQAIVVYPMNALANSQLGELEKFLCEGYPDRKAPVTFARYTGQENDEARVEAMANPPDIILTNYVMLELILTREREKNLIKAAQGLKFLVLDELHTYRGRQGSDVALLVRRVRDRLAAADLQIVGTSATLAGGGTLDEQRAEVAQVATQIFGASVAPERVIGETLQRATPPHDGSDVEFMRLLSARVEEVARNGWPPAMDHEEFVQDPLASWVESAFGVVSDPATGRLVRAEPISIRGANGAAAKLEAESGVPEEICAEALENLLLGAYGCLSPDTGLPVFAFRLHQFVGRGETVYATPETEDRREISLQGQKFVPGERGRVFLPLVFCRECGQEYYAAVASGRGSPDGVEYSPRGLSDRLAGVDTVDGGPEPGLLYISTEKPWPLDAAEVLTRVPDDWLEAGAGGGSKLRKDRVKSLPRVINIGPDGGEVADGVGAAFIPGTFRFCLSCGVSYAFTVRSDFGKLGQLGSGGRSSATTVMGLSTIRTLRDSDLAERARKLLSFTDNRQDASLQAGHFNDFVEVGLLRSALYRAAAAAGEAGLRHDELAAKVFDALALPLATYAQDPEVKFAALHDTQAALRNALGYRLYRDLKRGWRITLPNLEQSGLLQIGYQSLEELCAAEEEWAGVHPALVTASPETRSKVAGALLDFMRRGLAIKVDYLEPGFQERLGLQSNQRLCPPWAIDDKEPWERAATLFARSKAKGDDISALYLSSRSGFARYLRRTATFPDFGGKLRVPETETVIRDLLKTLRVAGLVEEVAAPRTDGDTRGYQVPASALVWRAGDGSCVPHDPIRVPNLPDEGAHPNSFFVDFYRQVAQTLVGLEAREHTAQVTSGDRQEREDRFREGRLPILFCSPTMELGVDIAELNVVNMRNVPPTPANYAQRSGRAGRSGQPALVYTYCSTGSPHDQYFFRRPGLMVSGAVAPPRIDLANEDLVRAHVHAVWLAETGESLGRSLVDVLDLAGEEPTLAIKEQLLDGLSSEGARARARARAETILATFRDELEDSDWYTVGWLDEVLGQVVRQFDRACQRWRDLFRSAHAQAVAQQKIKLDASATAQAKSEAQRLRAEAEQQLNLLTQVDTLAQSDFYSYRYFASEGFLPGYSFPRLPLSAYIPGRRFRGGRRDEFLSRPRFLAISEFGPRAIVYHEGSRYTINKAILPVGDDDVITRKAKLCGHCGYLHEIPEGDGPDLCESCGTLLGHAYTNLFRMQNVSTKRRDHINSDEEERMRYGYELLTGMRFAERGGEAKFHKATVESDGAVLATLTYGHAATIWRANLGLARRKNKDQFGFVLDTERGYWASDKDAIEADEDDPLSARTTRVIPFVDDRRNCLIVDLAEPVDADVMLSLQAVLKRAIQALYQLEDGELAVESLPSDKDPRRILLYEAAEGGAGALRRLLDSPGAVAEVARGALAICHFDPTTGADQRRALGATEDCEAACYDCLLSYQNQRYHGFLDRQLIRELMVRFAQARVAVSGSARPRAQHLAELKRLAGSDLERRWLDFLEGCDLRLPSSAQRLIEACSTRPDFFYDDYQAAVYIDGPPHDYPERQARDAARDVCMDDGGFTVIRFHHQDDWGAIIDRYPYVFGGRA